MDRNKITKTEEGYLSDRGSDVVDKDLMVEGQSFKELIDECLILNIITLDQVRRRLSDRTAN